MSRFEKILVRWSYTCVAAVIMTLAISTHASVSGWFTLLLVVLVVLLSALAMERHS